MNLILFDPAEVARPLPRTDPRAEHLLMVLRRSPGDEFDAGIANGPRGKGRIEALHPTEILWSFREDGATPEFEPIALLIGLPRPQTARKILNEAATLGVQAMHFVLTDRGEPNYANSTLWTSGEWRRHVRAGVEQAFATRVPEVTFGTTLAAALARIPPSGTAIALDNYEAPVPLSKVALTPPIALIIGSERGWSPAERTLLRATTVHLAHLGPRVLRTETATVAALSLLRSRLGAY